MWFGVAFGAHSMSDQPWTLVVEGGSAGRVTERKLGNHAAGSELAASVRVMTNEVDPQTNMRTVVLTRWVG